jgi:hypothetical protein
MNLSPQDPAPDDTLPEEDLPPTPGSLGELLRHSTIFPRLFVALTLFFTFVAIWYFMR